jgi:hypothetical protein
MDTSDGTYQQSYSLQTFRKPIQRKAQRYLDIYEKTFVKYPPIQLVPEALPQGVKRQGLQADHSPPSSADVKNGKAVTQFPIHLHGVVLN